VLPDEVGSASFGPAVPVFYLPSGSASADMIGVADQVAPAQSRHALWLVNYPPHVSLTKAIGVAQEFTTNGLSVGRPVLLPAGHALVRGTKRGLLLAPVATGGQTVRLWNPATSRFTATFRAVAAASADAIAYTAPRSVGKHPQGDPRTAVRGAPCDSSLCLVHVQNLVTGYKLTLRVPPGHVVTDAQFSPDGRYLALEVSAGESSDSSTLEVQLEVATLASGRLTILPHTWATGDPVTGLGWPGNDDRLVAKLNTGSEVQMLFWAPGHRSLALAAVPGSQNPADIVVGS
jgi:WD40 repeat protein